MSPVVTQSRQYQAELRRKARPQLHPALTQPYLHIRHASGPNPTPGRNPLKIWPFIAIALLGTYTYTLMVKSRTGDAPRKRGNSVGPQ